VRRERPWGALQLVMAGLVSISSAACGLQSDRKGVPPDVAAVVDTVTEDIDAERYETLYQEASDLWKQELTLEESTATFKTLRAKLGKVRNRTLHNATEQHNSGGPLQGEAFILTYRTEFERGEGMETFTLVKHDGRWLLARYFVNSMALK
jgi:vacuolar-type H+-ATPase subunit I/STV1